MSQIYFQPAITKMCNLTTVATAPVQPSTGGYQNYRLFNISTGPNAFVMMGVSTATATIPLGSAGSTAVTSFVIGQNQERIVTGPPNAFFSGATTAATLASILVIEAGRGFI